MSENGETKAETAAPEVEKSENAEPKSAEPENTEKQSQEVSPLDKKIIKQIEFYFGNANLSRDKFLQAEIKADDGWVPISTMLKFNRLAQLSTDGDVITGALRKTGDDDGLMEVSEDASKIRRRTDKPLPEITTDTVKDSRKRTVYAKNFPLEVTLDELMTYFEEFGDVELVKMRRDGDMKFKGSVFTTFKKLEGAEKFLSEARQWKVDENSSTDLITKTISDYYDSKTKDKRETGQKRKHDRQEDKAKKDEEYEKNQEERLLAGITRGAILVLTGLKNETRREDISAVLGKYGTIAWQDFEKGATKAVIRFENEGEAKTVWEKAVAEGAEGKVSILEQEVEGQVLEGDEETEHWRSIRKSQSERRSKFNSNKRRGGGGGRYGGPRAKHRKTQN